MTDRMLMVGLDSIDWMLMNEWMEEGRLPVLRGILNESGTLLCREPNRPLPGSIWTDIATGASAAFHGYVHEQQLTPNSYRWDKIDSSYVAVEPFYKTLSDAGIRCAVVDFPVDYPISGFNGIQVVDWGTEFKLWRFETEPSSFAARLVADFGKHPLMGYGRTRTGIEDLIALKQKLKRGIEIKLQLAIDIVRRREHDFIFINFAELHKAGHFFWKFHDEKHPEFTKAEPRMRNSLLEMYEAMDQALGTLLTNCDPNDDLVLVTDRGMIADHRGDHLVDDLLTKFELAIPTRKMQSDSQVRRQSWRSRLFAGRPAVQAIRFVGKRILPDAVRELLLPYHRAAVGAPTPLDWQRTRVFRLPTVGNSYLRVNLSGREPRGIVSPGADYERELTQIANRFRALINPATGERAVEDIYFPAKQFAGPKSNELPDVAIVWNSNAPINSVTSDDIGTIEGLQKSERSGNHRPDGFAMFRGGSFDRRARIQDGDARQIAPIILNQFGVSAPAHYEMRSPEGLGSIAGSNR